MWNIRNRTLVSDYWREELDSPSRLPSSEIAPGDIVVSLQRWCQDQDQLVARGTRIGVRLAPDEDVFGLRGEHFHELWMVDLEFPGFAEGRGYSQARRLRQGLRFDADLRAVGDLGRDRIAFMERCGINVFRFQQRVEAQRALAAFDELSLSYQEAADRAVTIGRRRGHRHAA